jgi:hypothetical protein
VDVAVVLIEGGARLDTPGGSIGTPLDNAIGYGCWNVARLLAERGAPVDRLWHAAALGMLTRLDEILAATPSPAESDVNQFSTPAKAASSGRHSDSSRSAPTRPRFPITRATRRRSTWH